MGRLFLFLECYVLQNLITPAFYIFQYLWYNTIHYKLLLLRSFAGNKGEFAS